MSDRDSDHDSDTASDIEEDYDTFNQFCNGYPLRIIDWIRMGKVSVDAIDEDHGDTLLQWAARHRVDELARFLIRRKCDLNHMSNADGKTALDLYEGHVTMVKLLRDHGAKTSDEVCEELDNDEL